jgi:hypothetical protein
MPSRLLLIQILTITQLTGCAAYTVASIGTTLATGRGISEWTATGITGADCALTNLAKDKYLCEQPVVYNRHGL